MAAGNPPHTAEVVPGKDRMGSHYNTTDSLPVRGPTEVGTTLVPSRTSDQPKPCPAGSAIPRPLALRSPKLDSLAGARPVCGDLVGTCYFILLGTRAMSAYPLGPPVLLPTLHPARGFVPSGPARGDPAEPSMPPAGASPPEITGVHCEPAPPPPLSGRLESACHGPEGPSPSESTPSPLHSPPVVTGM